MSQWSNQSNVSIGGGGIGIHCSHILVYCEARKGSIAAGLILVILSFLLLLLVDIGWVWTMLDGGTLLDKVTSASLSNATWM